MATLEGQEKRPELHAVVICQSVLMEDNRMTSLVRIADKFNITSPQPLPQDAQLDLEFEVF